MATKDNSLGLLARMARFVRHPTQDWAAQEDKPEPEPESGYSKQALKEMIERKRQNDFVRRREFDHLRKLRRNQPVVSPDPAGRPSFFQSSLGSNLDERATTLRKIDEIEAQMSKQWWKGKQEEASLHGSLLGSLPAETTPTPLQDTVYGPTQMGLSAPGDLLPRSDFTPLPASGNEPGLAVDLAASGFSSLQLFSTESGDSLLDPDLDEAAIRFANGDDAGAEAGLLAALQAEQVEPSAAAVWAAALFDLYRATGQQASFDRVAIDYAQRFGRSAPGWFSTPELLLGNKAPAPLADKLDAPLPASQTVWVSPAELDLRAVQALRASLSPATTPWRLDWSRLRSLAPEAAKALAELFSQWCAQTVKLHFDGAEALEKTLRSCTPSGDRRVDPVCWQLRLDALRILHLQDEFELAALDFCVTYEVSPPPWEDARCDYVQAPLNSTAQEVAGAQSDTVFDTLPMALVELSGEVLGDAAAALNQFQDGSKGSDRLVVSCTRLIRVDFSAAGSILNWVAARESAGCHVQFHDVPSLVAAFFKVIGINEHAKVIVRTT